ncbi:hypothetical protein PHET_09741 [Paragonimus heterotremus]|uniref:Uncharacterized protein n=1 Tax=Paragonimus heterotremus TaxID=100268 RepID=A0A8J4SSE6_9TREM|nr:hypothetical protein PHET_09741 [Paragonimus heterotremus]
MGAVVSSSKLKADNLRESHSALQEAQWTADSFVSNCSQCHVAFSFGGGFHPAIRYSPDSWAMWSQTGGRGDKYRLIHTLAAFLLTPCVVRITIVASAVSYPATFAPPKRYRFRALPSRCAFEIGVTIFSFIGTPPNLEATTL